MINARVLTSRTTAIELTNRMRTHLRNERGSMADFLLDFARFDEKQLWRELGYAAPFPYLRGEFKLSRAAAYQRLLAARLIRRFPEIEAAVRSEDLCLSSIHEVAKVLTPGNVGEVLPRFFGLSAREAAEVAVSLKPVEIIPAREVVIPVRPSAAVMRAVAAATLELAATNGDSGEREVGPAEPVGPTPTRAVRTSEPDAPIPVTPPVVLQLVSEPPRDSVEPLNAELFRLHVTVSRAFLDKLEGAKDRLAHACPGGSAAEVLEHCLEVALAEHAKRNGLVENPRKEAPPSSSSHIPAHVKREVLERAGGWRCEWVLENGKRCDCTRRLQFDHVQALALGGESTVENVRLVCQAHNLLAARRTFGDAVMDRYAPGPSEPRTRIGSPESLSLGLGGELDHSS